MKIVRSVIGIASIIAFFIIFVQSCGFDVTGAHGSGYGLLVGTILIVAGVIGYVKKIGKITGIIAGILYLVAAALGFAFMGIQPYLKGWAIGAAVAGVFYVVSSLVIKDLVYGEKPKFK